MVFARGGTFAIRCIQFAPSIRAKTISADLTPLEASFSRATCFIYRTHYWQTDKRETVNFFCSVLGFAYVTKRMKRKLRTAWVSIPLSWWKKRLTVSKTNRDFGFSFYTSIPIIHKKNKVNICISSIPPIGNMWFKHSAFQRIQHSDHLQYAQY